MNVLIIGATGTIGSAVRETLLTETKANLTLVSRHASSLQIDNSREKAINGDVLDQAFTEKIVQNQDLVFVSLSGNLKKAAISITKAMKKMNTKRIIFITSMGIYNEIPESIGSQGNLKYNSILQDYRNAADIIEDSGMDYTIIRPGWFIQGPVNYELTQKGQAFGGHDVSISSISDLVKRITLDPELYSKENIGINQKEK